MVATARIATETHDAASNDDSGDEGMANQIARGEARHPRTKNPFMPASSNHADIQAHVFETDSEIWSAVDIQLRPGI